MLEEGTKVSKPIRHAMNLLSKANGLSVEKHKQRYVAQTLKKYFNLRSTVSYIPLDGRYYIADLEAIKEEVKENHIDHRKYKKNIYDCENFALSLFAWFHYTHKSNQIGIAYSRVHGYNIVVLPKKKLRLLEPQSDRFFTVEEAEKKEARKAYPEEIEILNGQTLRMDKAIEKGMYQTTIIQL